MPAPQPEPIKLEFPVIPDPKGNVKEDGKGNVVMPADYWLRVAKYMTDVERLRELNSFR